MLKWYLQRIVKLPRIEDNKQRLGTVGHGVSENFLLQKELYPKDWEFTVNRFTGEKAKEGIPRKEQALVKALIKAAVDNGVLHR